MKKLLLVVSMAALLGATLSGCGSSVKLDDVPVTDVAGKPVSPDDGKKSGTGVGAGVTESAVKPVAITKGGPDDGLAAAGPRIVYFDYDSYVVKPEFQPVVEAHARYLKGDKNRKMAIEGHTDERGGREYNLALGQKRSEAVRRAIGLLGGNDAQIEAVSFGKEKPAANGSDEAALAKNRRAEINYR